MLPRKLCFALTVVLVSVADVADCAFDWLCSLKSGQNGSRLHSPKMLMVTSK